MPEMDAEQSKVLLAQIEKELGALLSRHLGYRRELLMTIIIK